MSEEPTLPPNPSRPPDAPPARGRRAAPDAPLVAPTTTPPVTDRRRRPIIERLGLALVAIVLASLFGAVAAAAWTGGELFLAAMGALGCAMTLWVGALTLFRG